MTLIIDDLHLLERDHGTGPLRDALRRASGSRRLVIATRSDPILALHEARLAGKVMEIRADELTFDEDETRLFLAANHVSVTLNRSTRSGATPRGGPQDSGSQRRRCHMAPIRRKLSPICCRATLLSAAT